MGTEISVTFEIMDADFFGVRYSITVAVTKILQPNGLLRIVLAEQIAVLVFVAGGDEFLQAQLLKVIAEIMEKVAYTRVIAVAKHSFAFKMLLIMPQLVLNVNKLSIKLVFFGIFRLIQILICHRD